MGGCLFVDCVPPSIELLKYGPGAARDLIQINALGGIQDGRKMPQKVPLQIESGLCGLF
jgi:hypothetical protein